MCQIFSSKSQALVMAQKSLNFLLVQLNEEAQNILFMLSGGSAFKLLDGINPEVLSDKITLCVVDERFTNKKEDNNWWQITQTEFYKQALAKGCHVIPTSIVDSQNQAEFAQEFEQKIKTWLEQNPDGKIIATLGMGPDGHTAGLIPDRAKRRELKTLFQPQDPNSLIVSYKTDKNPYPYRVSANFHLLRKIDHARAYIVGAEKKPVLFRALADKGNLVLTPARIFNEMKDIVIFTD